MQSIRVSWLVAACVTALAKVAFADTTNPPPTKALGGFASYELQAITLDAADAATKGKDTAAHEVQGHFDALVAPVVKEWNDKPAANSADRLVIEPRIDEIKKVSGGARFWGGAWAGNSHVTMHVKLTEQPSGVVIAEPIFFQQAAAMSGAWTVGAQDKDMLRRIAKLVADYLRGNYDTPKPSPTGSDR